MVSITVHQTYLSLQLIGTRFEITHICIYSDSESFSHQIKLDADINI